ncbi:hypothetical protein ACWWJF_23720 [Symbiopectobacterium sp. Eva_TO]
MRTDNLLNIKTESAFVQTACKEKGPRPALRVMQLLTCEEANELHHNSRLQATGFTKWHRASQALGSMPNLRNFSLQAALTHALKLPFPAMDSICSSNPSSKRIIFLVLPERSWLDFLFFACIGAYRHVSLLFNGMRHAKGGYLKKQRPEVFTALPGHLTSDVKESNAMAEPKCTQTRPKFTDTYWIIPEYSTVPYGKVSFTRQDRRTFIALFKDSRLIWAGRQPVNRFTQGLKDPKSQKVGVKRSANPTMSAKGTESRSQFNQSPGLLVRKMSHEGIEEISIPQGMVKITTPSTITNIVTVPATITEIVTVQGVAHV